MQSSDKTYLHSNTLLFTILCVLTIQNNIISLTETIFTGVHVCSFPSCLPSFHHLPYTIVTIFFYGHKFKSHTNAAQVTLVLFIHNSIDLQRVQ
jgi:hypothetical protein